MKTLVVCYSNSGTTALVAERIAGLLGAGLDAIEEITPRPRLQVDGEAGKSAGGAMARAALAAWLRLGASICETQRDPAQYDLVVVGSPAWAGSVTPAVRSYLKRHRRTLPRVALFCTAGDPTKRRALDQMRKLAGREPVATLAVKMEDAHSGACAEAIAGFVAQIEACR